MLKRFIPYTKRFRKEMIIATVTAILECFFELTIPMLMASLVDIGIGSRDMNYILRMSILMVVMSLLSLVMGAVFARNMAIFGQGFGCELRQAEYEKVQQFSFSNLDKFSSSSLVTRLTSDVTIMQNALVNGYRQIIRGPFNLIVALSLALAMNMKLAVVFMAAIPVLAAGLLIIINLLRPMFGRMQKAMDMVNSVVQESLVAIRVVKAYVRGEYEAEKFDKVNSELRSTAEQAFGYAVMNAPIFQTVMYATIICLLWFGNGMIQVGDMAVGELTGFLSYVLLILNALMMISGVFLLISRSITSGTRILEVMDEPVAITSEPGGDLTVADGSVQFCDVSFKYYENAREYVLSNINLRIESGQTIGIMGGTGSAKSSLVQLIPRLYDASSGSVMVSGHDVRKYPVSHLRDAVGVVLQSNTLFTGTVRENLLWGNPNAAQEELDWACRISAADEVIEKLPQGYESSLGQGGGNVSGGQKQRLCIARALLKRPKILIFDDSTSAVDTATEARIREGLASELSDTTKIIIAQRITSVQDADKIIILDQGKIDAVGTHEQLLSGNEIYREIYTAQQKGAEI